MQKDLELPVSFSDKAHEALMNVWWTAALLKKEYKRIFKKHLKSEVQFNILMALKYSDGPVSQTDLSKMLLVFKSNITGVIDVLESENLIKRVKTKKDRRRYNIILTAQGKEFINKLDEIYTKNVNRIMSLHTKDEIGSIIFLMGKIRIGLGKAVK